MAYAASTDQIHIHWFGLGPGDWAILSSAATIVGVAVALLGGVIALTSYRAANRVADNAHMHGLFRDYLRVRFDTLVAAVADPRHNEEKTADLKAELEGEVASLKLYVLEEMWGWLHNQGRRNRSEGEVRRGARQEVLDAWAATIVSHVRDDCAEVIDNLERNTECYSMGFLEFLAGELPDEKRFQEIWAHQRNALDEGRPRKPLKPATKRRKRKRPAAAASASTR